MGVLVAAAAAYGLARLFAGYDAKVFLPLWFVTVLVALAVRYGIMTLASLLTGNVSLSLRAVRINSIFLTWTPMAW